MIIVMPLDLSILNGEEFEDLIEAIFRAQTPIPVIDVERSGRGADQGRDLKITTLVTDGITLLENRWPVQCKHNARGGRAVGLGDFDNSFSFTDLLSYHDASGLLLVCSTRPATNLQALFDKLAADRRPHRFVIWDCARVCEEILKYECVWKQFFPEEYRRQQDLIKGERIKQWALEHKDHISPKALEALSDIVATDSTLTTDEEK